MVLRSTLDPLDDLITATQRVRGGDVTTRVPVVTADEFGTLAYSFNQMLEGLRERESLREELRTRADELRASRARIVAASDAERRRVERNIHDGAQQRLVALALELRLLEEVADSSEPEQLRAMAAEAGQRLQTAIDDLRDLARGLHPSVLVTDGLRPALELLVTDASLAVSIDAPRARFPDGIESTAYFVVSEALANVAKHAQASRAGVQVMRHEQDIVIRVSDDGIGGASPGCGSGLVGLADRVAALDGSFVVESEPGQGTIVTATLPLDPGASR